LKGNGAVAGWVLITGASAGIGRELAQAFAARGHDLILTARNEEALAALARDLVARRAVKAKTMPADLSLPGAAEAMVEALEEAGLAIDILVNNAGVAAEGDFARLSLDDCLRLLQVNVVALTSLTRLLLPPMMARRRGRILNVASIAGFMPVPRLSVYAASKAYVLSLTEALSEELRGAGVTATALCPGLTDTAMVRESELGKPIPAAMIMSAKDVAEAGCAACLAGEAICVPGLGNRLLTSGAPLLPRGLVRAIGGAMTGGGWDWIANALQASGFPGGRSAR
jgi:hypothetical protein